MSICTIRWCGKNSKTSSSQKDGITFHRYPKHPDIKKTWINKTRRKNWSPATHSVICSRHFTEECFIYMKNRRRLLKSAVPTLYLPLLLNEVVDCNADVPMPSTSKQEPLVKTKCLSPVTVSDTTKIKRTQSPPCTPRSTENSLTVKIECLSPVTVLDTAKIERTQSPPCTQRSIPKENSLTEKIECLSPVTVLDTVKIERTKSPPCTPRSMPKENSPKSPSYTETQIKNIFPGSPTDYTSPVKQRMCRRIIELSDMVMQKNRSIKNLREKTRYMHKKLVYLKHLINQARKTKAINSCNADVLSKIGMANRELVKSEV